MARPRFGPKCPVAAAAEPKKLTGEEKTKLHMEALFRAYDEEDQKWEMIENLLKEVGYEIVPDLYEHSIKKIRPK